MNDNAVLGCRVKAFDVDETDVFPYRMASGFLWYSKTAAWTAATNKKSGG